MGDSYWPNRFLNVCHIQTSGLFLYIHWLKIKVCSGVPSFCPIKVGCHLSLITYPSSLVPHPSSLIHYPLSLNSYLISPIPLLIFFTYPLPLSLIPLFIPYPLMFDLDLLPLFPLCVRQFSRYFNLSQVLAKCDFVNLWICEFSLLSVAYTDKRLASWYLSTNRSVVKWLNGVKTTWIIPLLCPECDLSVNFNSNLKLCIIRLLYLWKNVLCLFS